MSYSDFLDYWLENYCYINLKYHTIEGYSNIIKNHIKPNIGYFRLSQITRSTLQEFINKIYVNKSFSKNFLNNIKKVIKGSFIYAYETDFIKVNPAIGLKLPKYDIPPEDPAHIFTNEEINLILDRFKNNHCVYYAFLTAYCTGLRIAEVFALTWDDIDFYNKTISINKNILKKNQAGGTRQRHISGNSTTVWYFGTCKTETSYRTIPIGDTLVNALKEYKQEQEEHRKNYGDTYMKHYKKTVINPYNNKQEIKIINAHAEIDVALPEVKLVFLKNNGVFEGTDSCKYPFKVIHYELGIPCRFHDFRDTHATRLIESGADINVRHTVYDKPKDDKGRWYIGTTKTKQGTRQISMSATLYNALLNYKKKQQYMKKLYGKEYLTYHFEDVLNKYGKVVEQRIVKNIGNVLQINKADMVFTRPNGKYVGRNILNYPFKIIHKELGIENCRFYDLRGSYATINLRNGIEIRDVADILGHKYIETTENFYITSTDENKKDVSNVFDNLVNSKTINDIIKYEIAY